MLFLCPYCWIGGGVRKKHWWIVQLRHRQWRENETHKYGSDAAAIEWHPWPFCFKEACAYDRWFTQIHKLIFVVQGYKNFGGRDEKLRPEITRSINKVSGCRVGLAKAAHCGVTRIHPAAADTRQETIVNIHVKHSSQLTIVPLLSVW